LVVITGPRIGQRLVLGEGKVDIGRGSQCGLMLDIDSVSRQHARVEWTGTGHKLVDNGSTNGTFVNEHRVTEHPLRDGDRIQIGKALIKYVGGGNIEAAYHEEIQRLMRFDGLTGVHNKSHFDETLQSTIWATRTTPQPVSLILFDLDHFKRVNDTHGHTAGDAVLRQVAAAVQKQMTQHELLARVGGEEFAVLCPGMVLRGARELAERVRGSVARTRCSFEDLVIPVTLSLGVAERASGGNEAAHKLYERADNQLYAAKNAGRNCVR
jgi:diguanylate cyclase (GGDEF)-like protein